MNRPVVTTLIVLAACCPAVFALPRVAPSHEVGHDQSDDRGLLRAKFYALLARGEHVEAVKVARKLVSILPNGPELEALRVLIDSLDSRTWLNQRQKLLAEATVLRERGETAELLASLARLSGDVPTRRYRSYISCPTRITRPLRASTTWAKRSSIRK